MTRDTASCDQCGVALNRGQLVVFIGRGRIYRDQLEIVEPVDVFCSMACLKRIVTDKETTNPTFPLAVSNR